MTDWSVIVDTHGPLVWRTVFRLLNNEADAADCFQNTFLAALKMVPTTTVRNWAGLLKRLATVQALDRLRVRYRDRDRHSTWPETEIAGTAITPSQLLEQTELAGQLRSALTTLDARQAEVFCLACLEGLNYRDIGEQLGLSVTHVGVLLNRARTCLRDRLAEHRPSADTKETE